jgi:hypothetical protein
MNNWTDISIHFHLQDNCHLYIDISKAKLDWCLTYDNNNYQHSQNANPKSSNKYIQQTIKGKIAKPVINISDTAIKFGNNTILLKENVIHVNLKSDSVNLKLFLNPSRLITNLNTSFKFTTNGIIDIKNEIVKVEGKGYFNTQNSNLIILLDNNSIIKSTNDLISIVDPYGLEYLHKIQNIEEINPHYHTDIITNINIPESKIYNLEKTKQIKIFFKNKNQIFYSCEPYWKGEIYAELSINGEITKGKGFYKTEINNNHFDEILKGLKSKIKNLFQQKISPKYTPLLPPHYLNGIQLESVKTPTNIPIKAYLFAICYYMVNGYVVEEDISDMLLSTEIEQLAIKTSLNRNIPINGLLRYIKSRELYTSITPQLLYRKIRMGLESEMSDMLTNSYLLLKGSEYGLIGEMAGGGDELVRFLENVAIAYQMMYDEGCINYSVLRMMNNLDKKEQIRLCELIVGGENIKVGKKYVEETNIIANRMVDEAWLKVDKAYPDSYFKTLLYSVVRYVLSVD